MMFLEFIRTSGNQIKKINDKTYLSDTEEPPRLCLENKNKLYWNIPILLQESYGMLFNVTILS